MTAINHFPKILFITYGPFGLLGTTASYMFPKIVHELGYDIKVLAFCEKYDVADVVIRKPPYVNEIEDRHLFDRVKILQKTIREFGPDIVHMFPVRDFAKYPFLCSGLRLHGKPKWLIDVRSPPLREKPLPRIFYPVKKFRDCARQAGFSCITTHVLSSAHLFFHKVFKPLYEVPFGVDLKKIKQKVVGTADKIACNRFVYVGSLARLRKLDTLIKGIHLAASQLGNNYNFTVDFIGEGNDLQNLKQYARKLGLNKIIRFKGCMPQELLYRELADYDVGIGYVPYEQYMGSPALKVIEYMAAGIGVIASDTKGVKIHVEHQKNGILFKNRPDHIANTIKNVVVNGYPVSYLVEARRLAEQTSWKVVVQKKLLPVYNTLLCKK